MTLPQQHLPFMVLLLQTMQAQHRPLPLPEVRLLLLLLLPHQSKKTTLTV